VQPAWASLSQPERNAAVESFIEACKPRAEEIAIARAKERGKPIFQARAQIAESFNYFHAYMEMAEKALAPKVRV